MTKIRKCSFVMTVNQGIDKRGHKVRKNRMVSALILLKKNKKIC